MIGELILTAISGGTIGYLISYFKKKYEDKKILKNIPEKIEKQNKKFFADGKELSIYDKEIKDIDKPVKPKPSKIVKPKVKPKTKPEKIVKEKIKKSKKKI